MKIHTAARAAALPILLSLLTIGSGVRADEIRVLCEWLDEQELAPAGLAERQRTHQHAKVAAERFHSANRVRPHRLQRQPQHVTPSWDMKTLWVLNDLANSLTAIDPATGKLKTAGLQFALNPFDEYGVEEGLRLKERVPQSSLAALSLGAPASEEALRTALRACGSDNILYGSDYPHQIGDMAGCLARVNALRKPDRCVPPSPTTRVWWASTPAAPGSPP